ncbi:MAG TPA: hypothetical protein VKC61_17005 [Pyrinomonadaceae bacterium]|nr:hypothetical protein [Pyrinomonadaceae bacterium]
MTNRRVQIIMRNALLTIAFLAATAMSAWAQGPVGPPMDRTNPDRERQQDMNRREMLLRGFGIRSGNGGPGNEKNLQALASQVEQDFSRILILHNEIARAISAGKSLDYGFVSNATTEIRKRALRLQTTLALQPEVSGQTTAEQIALHDVQVTDALIKLCKQIKSFVTNPVIENPGTISSEQLNKARKDLQSIVEVSSSIKRTAEKLAKTAK